MLFKSTVSAPKTKTKTGFLASKRGWSVVSGLVPVVRMRAALDCSLMCSVNRPLVSKMMREQSSWRAWTPSEDELLKSIVASVKRTGDVAGQVVVEWLVVSGLVSFVRMRAAFDCSLMC